MLQLKKIAVTGSICSGKTTVCQLFKKYGAYCINADVIAHQLLSQNTFCIAEVIQEFGSDIVEKDKIDRRKLASIVFADFHNLYKLEKILHPRILKEITTAYGIASQEKIYSFFVVEVPLLYEAIWEKYFDIIIYVDARLSLRRNRCNQRALNFFSSREKRMSIISNKKNLSDYIIYNNFEIKKLDNSVQQVIKQIQLN